MVNQAIALPFGKTQAATSLRLILMAMLAIIAGCITVNVYFPEGAVQRAADEFVKDLYKSTPANKPDNGATDSKGNKPTSRLLNLSIISSAHAADEISISTPAALAIKQKMTGRVPQISEFKSKGVIGESNTGTIVLKDASGLALKDRATVERLISAENSDRQALYDEVQKANHLNDRNQTKIRAHFSKAFQEHSPAGTWVQGESGGWTRK